MFLLIGLPLCLATLFAASQVPEAKILVFCTVLCFCAFGLAYALAKIVMRESVGTEEMAEVAHAVRSGAEGYMRTQYRTIFRMCAGVAVAIFVFYFYRPANAAQAHIKPITMASVTCLCFLFGAFCSALAGYIGLYICVRTNSRVASAARRGFPACLKVTRNPPFKVTRTHPPLY